MRKSRFFHWGAHTRPKPLQPLLFQALPQSSPVWRPQYSRAVQPFCCLPALGAQYGGVMEPP